MFQIFSCLNNEHDWRLVILAGSIAFFFPVITVQMLRATQHITGGKTMRKIVLIGLASLMLSAMATVSTPASAAEVKAVLDACDRTAGCDYHQSKDGSITGCSANANPPVCFNCPADGKKQCHQSSIKSPKGGKTATGASDKVLGVLTAAPTGKSKDATGAGDSKVRKTKQSGQKLETAKETEKVRNETISRKQVDDKKQSGGKGH